VTEVPHVSTGSLLAPSKHRPASNLLSGVSPIHVWLTLIPGSLHQTLRYDHSGRLRNRPSSCDHGRQIRWYLEARRVQLVFLRPAAVRPVYLPCSKPHSWVSLRVIDKSSGTGRSVETRREVQGPVDGFAVRRPLRAEKNIQVILDSSVQFSEVARFEVVRPDLRDTQLGSSVG
jgi:hypothetical protein